MGKLEEVVGRLGCEGLDWEVVEMSNRPEARRPSMALFEL